MDSSVSSISVTEAWLTFVFLAVVSALALRNLIPPAALPASAAGSDFSAERAFKHLGFYCEVCSIWT